MKTNYVGVILEKDRTIRIFKNELDVQPGQEVVVQLSTHDDLKVGKVCWVSEHILNEDRERSYTISVVDRSNQEKRMEYQRLKKQHELVCKRAINESCKHITSSKLATTLILAATTGKEIPELWDMYREIKDLEEKMAEYES